MLKGHGADISRYPNLRADFSSNVSWVDYSDVLDQIIFRNIRKLKAYPDVEYTLLREELAQVHSLDPHNFIITNGAVAAIYQCAQAFADSDSHLFYPEFSEYECALRMFNHRIVFSKFGGLDKVSNDSGFMMFGNPNNPTGKLVSRSEIDTKLKQQENMIMVIDESYMDFVQEPESMINDIREHPNLIIVKSFTKRYSIPGLRLGYIVAPRALIERLNCWTQPWSVNVLAAAVGVEIMKRPFKFQFDFTEYLLEKRRFYDALCQFPEFLIEASESNYFLIKLQTTTAKELKKYLIDTHQILVRDASNFRGLGPCYMRVSVRQRKDNDLLLDSLNSFIKDTGR